MSNSPCVTHQWGDSGSFVVKLTAYNDSFPDGLSASLLVEVEARTYYVDQSSATPAYPYTNWETAAHTIQEAVEAGSLPGRLVLVTNGVYGSGGTAVVPGLTNRVRLSDPVVVTSVNGPAVTTIRGAAAPGGTNGVGAVRCAYVGSDAVLSGFTLTNGHTRDYWSGSSDAQISGGGVWCEYGGRVSNCIIVSNFADTTMGGGGGSYGGTLANCVLTDGSAYSGGGACGSDLRDCVVNNNTAVEGGGVAGGQLSNCAISRNRALHRGGGVYYGGSLSNCLVTSNSASEGGGVFSACLDHCTLKDNSATDDGGAVAYGTLYNSVIYGNSANQGGGAYLAYFYNCTVTGNSAQRGGGICWGYLYNCIVYYNSAPLGSNYEGAGVSFDYSCTSPLPTNGTGNISVDPRLASLTHLAASSPCVGAGSAAYSFGVDIDGEPWLDPPCMGADQFVPGNVTGALTVAIVGIPPVLSVGAPLSLMADIQGPLTASEWDFGDGTVVRNQPYIQHAWAAPGSYQIRLTAYNDSFPGGVSATVPLVVTVPGIIHYVDQASATPSYPFTNWSTAARNIQEAVDAAAQGDTVLVTNGVYSSGGAAVYGTMTNRVAVQRPLRLLSVNGPEVTMIQGVAGNGGDGNGDSAIRCAYLCDGAVLNGFTLTNGHTRANAYDLGPELLGGGGVWCEPSAVVSNCVITGNSAAGFGGGAYSGIFYRSTLSTNNVYRLSQGAGIYRGWLYDCELVGNGFGVYGGGAYQSTLYSSRLTGNGASEGGGAFSSTLYNCVLTRNSAGYGGGAGSSTLFNCTVAGNSADQSGGVDSSQLYNCIVYYNTATSAPNWNVRTTAEDTCMIPSPTQGTGNITNEPLFMDPVGGDFRLRPDSPCINSGHNAYVATDTDAEGRPRISGGTVDMGALEFQNLPTAISIAWLLYYGLPIDGSADYADADHDGMNNWQEWIAGTDPTNGLSMLKMLSASNGPSGIDIAWQSVSGITYYLERCKNFSVPPVFSSIQSNIIGQAGTTTYTDTTAVGAGPFFYRVGVQ